MWKVRLRMSRESNEGGGRRRRGRGRKSVRSVQLRYRTAVGCRSRLKARPAVPVTAVMSHDLSAHESSYLGVLLAAMQSMDGGKPNLPLQANPERKET